MRKALGRETAVSSGMSTRHITLNRPTLESDVVRVLEHGAVAHCGKCGECW